ncbi:MAG: PAS domain S-box protein [Magnetococcales bacterium]|nr:PAS domain S-box protein [Magnetococcales bacterium]
MHQRLRQQLEQILAANSEEVAQWLQGEGGASASVERALLQGIGMLLRQVSESYAGYEAQLQQGERALHHSHGQQAWLSELQRAIVETAVDGLLTIDEQGTIQSINPAAERMFGYQRAALLGCSVTVLMPEAYRATHRQGMQRFLQSGTARVIGQAVEVVGLHADGHVFPIELRISRMQLGEQGLFVGIITDISERKVAEERLRRSEATIRAIVEKSVNTIIAIDIHGIVQLFNPAAERLFGYTAAEVVGQNVSLLMPSPDREAHDRYLQNYLSSGEGRIVGKGREVTARRRDGSLVVVDLAVSEIGIGQERQFVGMMTDLTAHKSIEQALQVARSTAEQANRMKSEFLANMSHELRTPMNAIMGMTHLLLQTQVDDAQRDYLRKMEVSSQSLLNLINNILDFSRLESGGVELQAVPFQLDDLLAPLFTRYQLKAQEKGLGLRLTVGAEVPRTLIGDPLRLGQVLNHLLNNAVKFTEHGQAGLEVDLLQRRGDQVQLQFVIWDSGIGMDNDLLARLFQPFTQGDGSSTRRYGGTGLGLAICKPLLERMGGVLTVSSEEGVGSRFLIHIDFTVHAEAESPFMLSVSQNVLQLTPVLQENDRQEEEIGQFCAVDWQLLLPLLQELWQLLEAGNTKAASRLATLRQRCGDVELPALTRIAALIDEYEYEEALETLRQMAAALHLSLE